MTKSLQAAITSLALVLMALFFVGWVTAPGGLPKFWGLLAWFGLVALTGSLAPDGAILKRSAADKNLFEHEGRAVVFDARGAVVAHVVNDDFCGRYELVVVENCA